MPSDNHTHKLIRNVQPYLNPGRYVFINLEDTDAVPLNAAICIFREKEGITCVLEQQIADDLHLSYAFIAGWITLNVYSSLEAVGLTARVSSALAAEHISCNAMAAFHHDHIFVPFQHVDKAMALLRKL